MSAKIIKIYEPSPTSEAAVLERLEKWREHFGTPMAPGRANPDNDLIYLMTDAQEVIKGLQMYARKLESALGKRHP